MIDLEIFCVTLLLGSGVACAVWFLTPVTKKSQRNVTLPSSVRFFVVGDWGSADEFPRGIADAMEKFGRPDAILSVGDHIYDNGAECVEDIHRCWTDVFMHHPNLQVPWYLVLGNHDYEGNIELQLTHNQHNSHWNMPATYFLKEFPLDWGTVEVYFLDTIPYMAYVKPALLKKWGYPRSYYRMRNFTREYGEGQLAWLKENLEQSKKENIRIIVTHYNIYTSGAHTECEEFLGRIFTPIIEKYNVHMFLNGHDHVLEHCRSGGTDFFTVGAGCDFLHSLNEPHPKSQFAVRQHGFLDVQISEDGVTCSFKSSEGKHLYFTHNLYMA